MPPRKNLIANGDFRVAQRGISFTVTGATPTYTLDCWNAYDSGATLSVQRLNAGSTLNAVSPDARNYIRVQATTADDNWSLRHYVEDVWTLSGKIATLSFWEYTDSGLHVDLDLSQKFGAGGSDAVNILSDSFIGSDGWTRHEITFDVPSVYGKTINDDDSFLWLRWTVTDNTTGAFRLADVQLEEGSKATEFEHLKYAEQLAWCQRFGQVVDNSQFYLLGQTINTTNARIAWPTPVPLRAYPTVYWDALTMKSGDTDYTSYITDIDVSSLSSKMGIVLDVTCTSNLTAAEPVRLYRTDASGYIWLDAGL
jgi:hypothetical protein